MTASSTPLVGLLLRLASQRWSAEMEAELKRLGAVGMGAAHAHVIPFVPPEGASIQWLAERANVRKQTMRQSVDQLVATGLAERRADPNDRRVSLVVLTEAGLAIRPKSKRAGGSVESVWADQIGRERLEELRATLIELTGFGSTG